MTGQPGSMKQTFTAADAGVDSLRKAQKQEPAFQRGGVSEGVQDVREGAQKRESMNLLSEGLVQLELRRALRNLQSGIGAAIHRA